MILTSSSGAARVADEVAANLARPSWDRQTRCSPVYGTVMTLSRRTTDELTWGASPQA